MEKKVHQITKENHNANSPFWDCESSLYDSFELNSFKRHLDSAIASRTFSMPHLSSSNGHHHQASLPTPPPPRTCVPSKASSKFSRSFSKILRSLFRPKPNSNTPIFRAQDQPRDGFYVFYEVGSLSTIPEVPEADFGAGLSPEISSLVKKTASERFTPNSIGISCVL
ncbi:putative inactive serine/threonine-protein kinase slob1 isoform X1 [Cucumis melo var. makuwa]|uniref:Inactive serine/threonine-protein kinase slob1 isoform X1 n=2 Tax=Cucumis melo TaxID=3656 RepID=A0A5D3CYZ1_CUCMM|nr:putative inactive serine/threonine-protein kinase slob1 isoform X1 [Cucumis melo var. makuwa]TYK16580.1 putative inactive serine/threonine-protein kinase slob1 isoform X1 [Cucumis melo var. makuwa]